MLLFVALLCFLSAVWLYIPLSVKADGETEGSMTLKKSGATPLASQLSYVDTLITSASSVEIEMRLGQTGERVFGVGFFSENTSTVYDSANKLIQFGACTDGLTYYENGVQVTSSISDIYNDTIYTDCLFGARTTFRLELDADGSLTVSAKLTETQEDYLQLGGDTETYQKLSAEFTVLHEFENFYGSEFVGQGCYVGFYFNKNNMVGEEVTLYSIVLKDSENNIFFGDNFYYFAKDDNYDNGYYRIMSGTVRAALNDGTLAVTRVNEFVYPYIDVSGIPQEVYIGEVYDISADFPNYGESAVKTLSITLPDGQTETPAETEAYTFEQNGLYTLKYGCDDATKTVEVYSKYKSTQPTYVTDFSSPWNEERVETAGAAIVNSQLVLNAQQNNPALFLTKGYSETFILTFSLCSLSGTDGTFSAVFGRVGNSAYRFTFTDTEIIYTDNEGNRTPFAVSQNYIDAIGDQENPLIVRLEKIGDTVTIAAIAGEEPAEKLNIALASVSGVKNVVGQAGIEVTGTDASAAVGKFQFVNMTTVVNDNTTVEAPEVTPDPGEPTDPPGEDDPNNANDLLWVWILVGCIGVAAVAGIAVVLILRKKKIQK